MHVIARTDKQLHRLASDRALAGQAAVASPLPQLISAVRQQIPRLGCGRSPPIVRLHFCCGDTSSLSVHSLYNAHTRCVSRVTRAVGAALKCYTVDKAIMDKKELVDALRPVIAAKQYGLEDFIGTPP